MPQKIKIIFFKIIEPIFPYVRDGLLFCRIIWHYGRQRYHIGYLDKSKNVNDLVHHLRAHGFHKNKIAWKDDGEILGMRRLDGFHFCYHVRLFVDGEIRGHYEYTVESSVSKHMREIGMEQRAAEFQEFLSGMLESNPELKKSTATVSR